MNTGSPDLAQVFRVESGQILAALINYCKDISLAEDALQDAFLQAMQQWEIEQPKNQAAWLYTVAKRRLIDRIRHSNLSNKKQTLQNIIDSIPEQPTNELDQPIPDERLKLIFTCCHPALPKPTQVALTLKTLCGIKVKEIARAYLSTEVSMLQKITRAKKKIKLAGIPYKVPDNESFSERLDSVLNVIYLIFNESYSAYEGQNLTRNDLAEEAIRLARLLCNLAPESKVLGLNSLMLFHQSRRLARSTNEQSFIPLEFQDRSLWDQTLIEQANRLLESAMEKGSVDSYQIQAAISALHAAANSWEETDWRQIILLYRSLYQREDNPIVELNYFISLAHSGLYELSLKGILPLEEKLKDYQPYYVARAYVYSKLGNNKMAATDYTQAIKMTKNSVERDYLVSQKLIIG